MSTVELIPDVVVPPHIRFSTSQESRDEPTDKYDSRDTEEFCWLFVEPLSGDWVCFAGQPPVLAVFKKWNHAHEKEQFSATLQRCVCHEVELSEMKKIAQRVCAGRWRWV